MGKKIDGILHMVGGAGETSYASNSKFPALAYLITGLLTSSQEKVLHMAKPILEEAIGGVYMSLLPERMAVVDLGCSSGPTTLEVVSEVLDVIDKLRRSLGRQEIPEILFFLNDLPGNDFNHVFRSLGDYKRKVEEEKGNLLVPYYVVGVPGSFYGRLFPCQSVHFFNASSCLNWLSQVPEGEQGVLLNNKNIYIAETSPQEVVKAYQDQRQRDWSEFLRCRHAELSYGARMVLSFVGRKGSYPPSGDMGYLFSLLAEALSALVSQGIIEEDKLVTFNLPYYSPSMEEVKAVIHGEDLFDLEQAQIFETNWDPFDDSDDDSAAFDSIVSGKNVAGYVRASFQTLIAEHFGDAILDELFSIYAANVSRHLLQQKCKHYVFVISLKKKEEKKKGADGDGAAAW
ncbi:carboxyl methyltransferase [Musa troglodytarum]|uniref:Carboxyl methyltransferase n=1 Tax=Musa troglodytarum TaxID=320322 RepID=A0A9E7GSG2_9LILI|nr:carboxyl methyltransferase [Musa troglodytarum]